MSCSICHSLNTNMTNCPLNETAENPNCDKHYNVKIIQRLPEFVLKRGQTSCLDESYNPSRESIQKTSCEDMELTRESYYIDSSPERRFLKTHYLCGSGSFKRVFLARDLKKDIRNDNSFVVWSELDVTNQAAAQFGVTFKSYSARIINEVKVMQKNNHPNVIKFINTWYNKQKKQVIIITEHLLGGDLSYLLKKRLESGTRFNNIELSKMFKDILSGLQYIHSRRLIHRDLKPGNIGIAKNGDLKLFDFGLTTKELDIEPVRGSPSLLRQQSTTDSDIEGEYSSVGTPEYMSPETTISNYDETVDIYAFGILAMEFIFFQFQNRTQHFREIINTKRLYDADDFNPDHILKKEYTRFLDLSQGNSLTENDIKKISDMYSHCGNKAHKFRQLVEDCILRPDMRLSAEELLKKYWPHNKILDFGK